MTSSHILHWLDFSVAPETDGDLMKGKLEVESYLDVVWIDHFPLKVEGLHGPVNLTHDVMRLRLAADAKMPFAPLDGGPSVSLLHWCHRLVSQRGDPLRVGLLPSLLCRGRPVPSIGGVKLFEVLLLLGRLDAAVVDDQVVGDHKSIVWVVAEKRRMYLRFFHTKLLTHL